MSLAQHLQRAEDFADHARDLGLADAGRAGEHHVLADGCETSSPCSRALLLDLQARRQLLDFLLDRRKADHRIKLVERGGSDPASLSSAFWPVAATMSSIVTSETSADGIAGHPQRLRFAGFLEQRAHLPRIGPVVGLRAALDPRLQLGFKAIRQVELLAGRHAPEDFAQLVGVVGRESRWSC